MTSKVQSDSELTEAEVNGEIDKNVGEQNEITQTSFPQKIKKILSFFTVEPFLFCYILPNVISSVAVQKLNMEKACRADLNYSEIICAQAISGDFNDNLTLNALEGAQKLVADMTTWKQPLQSGIPAAAILFIGAWSDKTGNRKLLMLIPMFGELVSAIGLIFATYFFIEWPLWVTALIEALPSAFSGGISIALMGSYSYISDVTTIESRTFRMGCVAVIVTLGIPLGASISGVLLELVGFYGIFGISTFLFSFGCLYTYFRIHDVKVVSTKGTCRKEIGDCFNLKNAWDTLSLLFSSPKKELSQIWLVVLAHVAVIGPVFGMVARFLTTILKGSIIYKKTKSPYYIVLGESSVLFLYTLKKFSMDVVDFSLFSTYSVLMGLAGTAVAVLVLSKLLKVDDALIGAIATTCKVVSSFVYAFAPNRTWFFTGPIFDFFGNSGTTVVRSIGTKVVSPDNVGKMCSVIGLVEAIVPVIYSPMYSEIYSNTYKIFPGAFYLLGGCMTVPAIFIFLYLYYLHRKEEKDVVKNPEMKEAYAHENAVTAV